MKWLFKWIFRLVFLFVLLIVALVLSKDAILKSVVERQIRSQTGMDVKIGKFSVGLLSPVVNIENFKLYNPPEFGGTAFLDVPELHVEYDRVALAYRELRIKLMRLNIAELNVVKGESGQTNVASLRWVGSTANGKRRNGPRFPTIETLNLSVGKARFVNLKHPDHNREYRPNLRDQVFKNIKSEDDLRAVLFIIWLRSGGGLSTAIQADQIFTLNCSPVLSESAKAASNCGICSRSFKLTTSTGECM